VEDCVAKRDRISALLVLVLHTSYFVHADATGFLRTLFVSHRRAVPNFTENHMQENMPSTEHKAHQLTFSWKSIKRRWILSVGSQRQAILRWRNVYNQLSAKYKPVGDIRMASVLVRRGKSESVKRHLMFYVMWQLFASSSTFTSGNATTLLICCIFYAQIFYTSSVRQSLEVASWESLLFAI